MDLLDVKRIMELAPSPAYVVDLGKLRGNLEILERVEQESGAKILLALKGFAMWSVAGEVMKRLKGVCASSVWEATLGREEFGGEVHTFAAAFSEDDVKRALSLSDHIVFNSFNQLERFRPLWEGSGVSVGLRVNPEHSEGHTPIYDPAAPNSRLGIKRETFNGRSLEGVDGLHFHTLCEHLFEPLERTAKVFEDKFGEYLYGMKWLNLGGGHHITREGYDLAGLFKLIKHFKEKYDLEVYLEPGEAVALGTGVLVGEVLDIIENGIEIAILNLSASTHMPDVLEMPYRPPLFGGFDAGEKPYTYRLAGPSCLAGDVMGDWSFAEPLEVGARIAFLDMAHYTMVKNTTFNGITLPDIATYDPESDELKVIRSFTYEDYRNRLS
ncbi:MAG: carboxynorspermidine decarboxylase [Deltaproteobacteria bacterium]|nr:MAG: carboxynorspermidine decarboxylase [Deltaproteobacteria bacterium]